MNKKTLWLNYLRPNIFVRNLDSIDVHALKVNGVRLIICDLDNTLVPHFTKFPNRAVYDFIDKVKNEGMHFVIASNNSKKRVVRFVDKLQETISIDGFLWNCKKPFIHKIKKFIRESAYSYDDIMVIGDQFITDVFLANRMKIKSILVLPMVDSSKNASLNMFFKILEKYIYKRLQHENILAIDTWNLGDEKYDKYELL